MMMERHASWREVDFLGLRFADLSAEALLRLLSEPHADEPFRYVVNPNADCVVRLAGDIAFATACERARLIVNDSRVLSLLARLVGKRLGAVPGSDLVADLLRTRASPSTTVCIIGGAEAAIDDVRARTAARIVHHNPSMGFIRDPAELRRAHAFIRDNPADVVLLAVGSPQQELLARYLARQGDCKGLALCCGAAVNLFVGTEARAPAWMRRCALEWLYRLAVNPRRLWRRYLVRCPRIFALCAKTEGWWPADPWPELVRESQRV
jgi:exopolysaccharide biosynthesis WecB/TagA/CpsF family protein